MAAGIYLITNIVTGQVYVGGASDLKRRWGSHRYQLRNGVHNNQKLQSSFVEHGESSFVFSILENINDPSFIKEKERHWIGLFLKNGAHLLYNKVMLPGAVGMQRTDDQKQRMSDRQKGKTFSDETRKRMSHAAKNRTDVETRSAAIHKAISVRRGMKNSEEHRAALSRALKGRVFSQETIEKMRQSALARSNRKIKPIMGSQQ